MPPRTEKQRFRRLILLYAGLGAGGLLYGAVCSRLGGGIPCLFRLVTGYQCPGCGVSRMCICLLHLDFRGAWDANPVILCMLPAGIYLAGAISLRYVKTGSKRLKKWENVLVYAMIAVLLLFGILRNL